MFKDLEEKKFIITENDSLEIETIKNNQIKILELRNTVSDMKMSLDGLNTYWERKQKRSVNLQIYRDLSEAQ